MRWTLWSRGRAVVSHETARSILDAAAAGMEVDHLARTISDALDRGLLTAHSIRAQADQLGPAAALAIERALRQGGL